MNALKTKEAKLFLRWEKFLIINCTPEDDELSKIWTQYQLGLHSEHQTMFFLLFNQHGKN